MSLRKFDSMGRSSVRKEIAVNIQMSVMKAQEREGNVARVNIPSLRKLKGKTLPKEIIRTGLGGTSRQVRRWSFDVVKAGCEFSCTSLSYINTPNSLVPRNLTDTGR